jgi:hypothetical protein
MPWSSARSCVFDKRTRTGMPRRASWISRWKNDLPNFANPSVADSFAGTRNIMTWLPRRRFLLMVKSSNVPLRRLRVPFTHSGLDGASTDRPLVRKAEAFVD